MIATETPRSWMQLRPSQPVVLRAHDASTPLVVALGEIRPGELLSLRWPAHAAVGGWFPGAVLEGEIGLPDGLWRFRSRVTRWSEEKRSLVLQWPFELVRVQRRDHARVRASAPARLRLPGSTLPELVCRTYDVSTGGVRLLTSTAIEDGRSVVVELELHDERVECHGRVIRSGAEAAAGGAWIAVEWAAPSREAVRAISRFVLNG